MIRRTGRWLELRGTPSEVLTELAESEAEQRASRVPFAAAGVLGITVAWVAVTQLSPRDPSLMLTGFALCSAGVALARRKVPKDDPTAREVAALVRGLALAPDAQVHARIERVPLPAPETRPAARSRDTLHLTARLHDGPELHLSLREVLEVSSKTLWKNGRRFLETRWLGHATGVASLRFPPGSAPQVEALGAAAAVFLGPHLAHPTTVTNQRGEFRVEVTQPRSPGAPWLGALAADCGAILSDTLRVFDRLRAEAPPWDDASLDETRRRVTRQVRLTGVALVLAALSLGSALRAGFLPSITYVPTLPYGELGRYDEERLAEQRQRIAAAESRLAAAERVDLEAARRHAEAARDVTPSEEPRSARRRRRRREEAQATTTSKTHTPTAPAVRDELRILRERLPELEATVAAQRRSDAEARTQHAQVTAELARDRTTSGALALVAGLLAVGSWVHGRRRPPRQTASPRGTT